MPDSVEILLDSNRGIYIPQAFAQICDMEEWCVSEDAAEILLDGPDNELYFETWDDVINNAEYIDSKGNKYRLYQDGDLFAYCLEKMTLEEQRNLFGLSFIDEYYVPDGFSVFEIGEHFVYPLYYGEYDGLEEDETRMLKSFVESNGNNVVDSIDYDAFGECEITRMKGKTCLVVIRNKIKE